MKSVTILKIVGTCFGIIAVESVGSAQTYVLPEQMLGAFGPGIRDSQVNIGGFSWGNGTLSDTAVISPTAYTIDQSGSVSLAAATGSFSFSQTEQFISTIQNFPFPPMTVTNLVAGTWTVNLSIAGGTFSFDTGVQPLTWNGSAYDFNGETSVQVPISISYSLATGGETYSGTDDDVELNYPLSVGGQLDTAGYPYSISISPAPAWIDDPGYSAESIANFTAADGFQADLVAQVPEPSPWALVGSGLVLVKVLRRKQA